VAHGRVTETIPAPARAVFDLIHDYPRRLEWDTLLQAAYLDGGNTGAGKGATAVCVGKWCLGDIALKTVYVTFDRPKVAAVKMLNEPPFFRYWAASLRHEDLGGNTSRVTYTFHFTARPRLRPILEPLMGFVFEQETRKRLRALKEHFERHPA
jgi:ribosome-associated toxin RatA of RatAB toxin-antitoxin module